MSLVADYSSSNSTSDDSSDSSDDQEQKCGKPAVSSKSLLPSANHLFQSSETSRQVFSNPFREAENAKIAALEKHVKMVNKDEHLLEKNGRKICWNYRKGRCRFGIKCTFAHDSDLSTSSHIQADLKAFKQLDAPAIETEDCEEAVKKRKRPGLSESVVPSKKVLKSYMHEKSMKSKPQ